jgi:hypothetical protein
MRPVSHDQAGIDGFCCRHRYRSDGVWYDLYGGVMTDPKTARDCLAHCLDVLTDEQIRKAVKQIEDYAVAREREAVIDCLSAIQRALGGNLFAEPPKGWWWQE